MSEYRYNLLTNQWVIQAPRRSGRPNDFAPSDRTAQPGPAAVVETSDFDDNCPFCPGHEHMTPPEVFALRPTETEPDSPGWSVRVVTNKYPAVGATAGEPTDHAPFACQVGRGAHEVIIESPHHSRHFARHDLDQAVLILRTLRDRYQFHRVAGESKLISIFNNYGANSGASLFHPHFQLIAPALTPPGPAEHLRYCRDYQRRHGRSVFAVTLEQELNAGVRIVAANKHFVAFCPFASMSPLELYVLPCHQQYHFGDLAERALSDLVPLLQAPLKRLHADLRDPGYNLAIRVAPTDERDDGAFCWSIQLCPRLSTPGGFEMSTQMYINTVTPEDAAAFYRGEINAF